MSRPTPQNKAANLQLDDIDDSAPATPRHVGATAPGQAMQNSLLRIELEQWKDASPVRNLDPTKVHRSRWANRHEASFRDAEFEALKTEIENSGGNVQPIKVRPLANHPGEFEVIFGHRRHQACLELGIPVLAMIAEASEEQVFLEMDRENRNRKDLRPYEQGLMYANALDAGLYPSLRKLAEAVGIDSTNASKSVRLARLPGYVLDAFQSPLDIQYRWSEGLANAVETRSAAVQKAAAEIRSSGVIYSAKEIFEKLVADPAKPGAAEVPHSVPLTGSHGQAGTLKVNPSKNTIEVSLKNIPPSRAAEFENLVRRFLGFKD